MMDLILQPWPWYVSGVLIGLTVPLLILAGNKSFGISSSLRHICAICFPARIPFFNYNWRKETWNLVFSSGIILGAFIAVHFLSNGAPMVVAPSTQADLRALGIQEFSGLLPLDIFGWDQLFTLKSILFMLFGGFLVGFGTRYAGGCTSGHSIMGLSNLQWPSLVATICFMLGGFISTWFLLPLLFKLV
jgi:uncharacterized membrane protein YedE/YeeE